ncbi:MAG TPA: phenylalanine--tRNA ligase subunit beta [Candidatus Omnitrophica bacterium]|nr:phenylalanine--tRNA ligase subunit beta [Candidatus Omnitrophota bacterium]
MKVTYSWLKDYVEIKLAPEKLADLLTMAGLEVTSLEKIEDDWVFEIEITSNRPDWLSVIGVAREIAALTKAKFHHARGKDYFGKFKTKDLVIKITDKESCSQYRGTIIEGVKIGPAPSWMQKRLKAIGLRPVNNIVDITNYCLYETGQPLHAFDLDKLDSPVEVTVRRAKDKEVIVTLDGIQRELNKDILVIADNNKAIAVAGIIGGAGTEVDCDTKNILLEAAEFDAVRVRRGTKILGLSTDSSYRFERNIDPCGVDNATLRAIELIQDFAGGNIILSSFEKVKERKKEVSIELCVGDVERILGLKINQTNIKQILSALGFKINKTKQGVLIVVPASSRKDVTCKEDLIEEIARIYGYGNIPSTIPYILPRIIDAQDLRYLKGQNLNSALVKIVRKKLGALGYSEVINYSLISEEALEKNNNKRIDVDILRTTNPLSKEQEVLRTDLYGGLFTNVAYNLNRKNNQIKIFELGKVFKQDNSGYSESFSLGFAACGRMHHDWQRPDTSSITFFDLKGSIEAMLSALGIDDFKFATRASALAPYAVAFDILVGQRIIGTIGEVAGDILDNYSIKEKQVFLAEISADELARYFQPSKKFMPYSAYPSIKRDISLLIADSLEYENIVRVISSLGKAIISNITLLEQYTGKHVPQGFKNLLVSLEYGSCTRTLKDREVDIVHNDILRELTEKLEVKIR